MKTLRTISAVLLALLVLFSSTSFMVGLHLCAGEVQNIAIFTKAGGCEKEQNLPPCHRHMTAPCCDDETIIYKAQELKAPVVHTDLPAPAVSDVPHALPLISEVIPAGPDDGVGFRHNDPPLPSHDLTVRHQVFLI